MATFRSSVVDKAKAPSQDPLSLAQDADAEVGLSDSLKTGVSGTPESEIGGDNVAWFGLAGAFSLVDDAVFVPDGNNVGVASQFMPGQRFSVGYQNEAHVREGVIVEGNLNVQNRPDGVTPDVKTAMGLP